MKALCLFVFLLGSIGMFAQSEPADTSYVEDTLRHSPTKATLMSLVVPGLGQAYNKKYWKIPLVYAIIGTPLYFALDQQNKFEDFKSALLKRVDEDPNTFDAKYDGVYTNENLENLIDFHRKNRDLLFVLTGVAYALNVVDAAVDAHLYYFDISDELSAEIKPSMLYSNYERTFIPAFSLSLKIGKKDRQLWQ